MKISYSILTHNEDESLRKLLEFLVKHKDEEDEIVILDDYSDNPKTIEILTTSAQKGIINNDRNIELARDNRKTS